MNNQPLRQVTETTYLGVVLTDGVSCAKDVDQARIVFLKQYSSINHHFLLYCLNLAYEV